MISPGLDVIHSLFSCAIVGMPRRSFSAALLFSLLLPVSVFAEQVSDADSLRAPAQIFDSRVPAPVRRSRSRGPEVIPPASALDGNPPEKRAVKDARDA